MWTWALLYVYISENRWTIASVYYMRANEPCVDRVNAGLWLKMVKLPNEANLYFWETFWDLFGKDYWWMINTPWSIITRHANGAFCATWMIYSILCPMSQLSEKLNLCCIIPFPRYMRWYLEIWCINYHILFKTTLVMLTQAISITLTRMRNLGEVATKFLP